MGTHLVRDLMSEDAREAAANALVALDADAVERLVRELADGDSPVSPKPIREVLQRIGPAGLEGLWEGFRSAPPEASRRRLGYAFSSFGTAALHHFVAALASTEPNLRAAAIQGIRDCGDAGRPALPALRLCTELSANYGQAQAYYFGGQGDGSAWLIAERGTVLRRYCESGDADAELLTLGEPLPYERERRMKVGLPPDWDPAQESEEDEDTWSCEAHEMAPDIARVLEVSPLGIGPGTPSRGTGVIALTPYTAAHGVPPGAFSI